MQECHRARRHLAKRLFQVCARRDVEFRQPGPQRAEPNRQSELIAKFDDMQLATRS